MSLYLLNVLIYKETSMDSLKCAPNCKREIRDDDRQAK